MKASKGSIVSVEYEGRLENGIMFDTSKHGDHSHPLEFVIGEGKVINGFEQAIIGMDVGDEKEITIMPEDAYGQKNPDLLKEIPKESLPKDKEPEEGMMLIVSTPEGKQFPVKISKIKDKSVVLDLNHPLAGERLMFKLKVKGVKSNSK